MDPITMSLLGLVGNSIGNFQNVGASFGGSALQYQLQKGLNKQSYKYQSRLLQRQMDFAERMANTAHQREVKDLRKAGLNPILSATGGNGATSPVVSAPGVSSGSAQAVRFEPSTVVDAIGTLAGIQNTAQQTQNLRTSEDLLKAQIATEGSKQQLNKANATKALADSSNLWNLPGKALNKVESRIDDIADRILKGWDTGSQFIRSFFDRFQNSAKPKKKQIKFSVTPYYGD